jgi:hypothetical protein
MRRSDIFLLCMAISLVLFGLLFVDAHFRRQENMPLIAGRAAMVGNLQLTDLCLFTEARYARHLSQADLHSPFQDYPMSAEHFPAGSLTRPPRSIRTIHEKVDRKTEKYH